MLSPIIIWVVFQIIHHLLLEEEGHILCLVQFRWGSFSWHYGLCHRLVKQVNLSIISVFIYYLTRTIQSFLYLTGLYWRPSPRTITSERCSQVLGWAFHLSAHSLQQPEFLSL